MRMLFIPDCQETTRLVSESMDRPLPLSRRLMVWIHLRMCRYCHRFQQQLLTLNAISRHIHHHLETLESSVALSKHARERIRRTLRAQSGEV